MNTSLQILFFIAVIILVAKLAGALSARLGLPLILGELLAGVLLGPTVLNIFSLPLLARPAGPDGVSVASVFYVLAEVGVVLLMFVAGLETDTEMMQTTVAPAFWAAAGGVALPMAGGAFLALRFHYSWPEALFIGTILTATSVTITAQTLMNLKQLRSRAGSTILAAAVIDDVMGLVVLSLVIAIAPQLTSGGAASWRGMALTILKMAICLVTMFWFGPPITKWIFRRAARLHGHHTEVAAALIVAFLLAFQAQWLGGMAAITGAYIAGLFVAQTAAHQKVLQDLHPMINSLFGPIFFVSIGLAVNARHLTGGVVFFTILLLIAIAGKVAGCGVGARLTGFTNRESMIVGIGMIPRGEVGLITASLGLAAGLVNRDVYVQVVVLVLITTLITPALLKYAFPASPSVVAGPALAIDRLTIEGDAESSIASGF
ncbi:MAG TPA: cation:proton antiporter [Candidatus Eisenbacteria bacterium]|nr:cation:proton antiporter [Candidatus Eisenbacteria bacterium]